MTVTRTAATPRLTSVQERALLTIADMDSVRIYDRDCIRTSVEDRSEITLSRATADALLVAGMVEHGAYRRVRITPKGLAVVQRLSGSE